MIKVRVLLGTVVLALLSIAAVLIYAQGVDSGAGAAPQAALGTGFTYQGQLRREGKPVDDSCWFAFRLYDDPVSGSQIGSPITTTAALTVTDGLFDVVLNAGGEFGPTAFNGSARWLDIRVKCPADPAFAGLGRQELTAAPYALYAVSAGTAGNADTLDGLHASELARIGRYYIPGGGGTVTITIPHYNAFQITIGEAYGSPDEVAWLSGVENDFQVAWTGIDPSGTIFTGTCLLSQTDTIVTFGNGITLRCPGTIGKYELVLTSANEDVRAIITW
ncbi:MAG TPA: hypothetical protein VM366_00010 [Anaerolineae bacterium]|nr:hypothetical protein [Anaerolineae bacterium]